MLATFKNFKLALKGSHSRNLLNKRIKNWVILFFWPMQISKVARKR